MQDPIQSVFCLDVSQQDDIHFAFGDNLIPNSRHNANQNLSFYDNSSGPKTDNIYCNRDCVCDRTRRHLKVCKTAEQEDSLC